MAQVVVRERLRDQIYNLVRNELKVGAIAPGQRLVEAELAERYGVSRTPVREALFQLARDGLLSGNERGYIVPIDTQRAVQDRVEVRALLEPQLLRHAAQDGTAEQRKALAKAFERQKAAHESGKYAVFIDANHQFRSTLRTMCRNELLARCVALVDDQFQATRNVVHKSPENRRIGLQYDAELLAAIEAGDPDQAESITRDFISWLRLYFKSHPDGE